MSEEASVTDWAQLVCLTDVDTPPFLIGKDKFTIGRAKSCDICHENNKLVSGTHCYILRDEAGKVRLYDSSTNGTLLNSRIKLTKGQYQEIEHGDEFYVVHKKGEEEVNIGYIFQDLARLKEEEADDSGELDQTLEYDNGPPPPDATILDDNINQIDDDDDAPRSAVKRKLAPTSETADPGPTSKKTKTEDVDKSKGDSSSDANPTTSTAKSSIKETKEEKKEGKTEEDKGQGGKEEKKKEGQKKEGGGEEDDAIAETLTCIICQELMYDCISLQPCMHSFCAGCYSEWMAHSSECPSCRGNVDRINKNHIVNNLIEAYLREHPDRKRPEEDLKDLDAKNKITRDMLYPKNTGRRDSDYEDSDIEDDEDYGDYQATPAAPAAGTIFGFGTPVFGAASTAFRAVCRQCPTAATAAPSIFGSAINAIKGVFTSNQTTTAGTTAATTTATTTAAAPSTSGNTNNSNDNNNNTDQPGPSGAGPSGDVDYKERDKKIMPPAPDYTCTANQNHVLCQCCLQIFPDRRTEYPQTPPQQCTICYRAYCHAYWGCRKADCNGCLAMFKDLNFGRKVLPGLILENRFESDVFTKYLDSKQIAVKDVLETCIAKLIEGTYSCPDQARYNITGETPLCFACGLRNFKALAYQYRADIPNDQLPEEARNRPDCYWGKSCRTQRNKPHHAMRFNHVCEQTRT